MKWFVFKNGKEFGPFEQKDFDKFKSDGKILPTDLVRPENQSGWRTLEKIHVFSGDEINWFVSKNRKEHGPFKQTDLKRFAQTGKLIPSDLVRPENKEKWYPASKVVGLFPPVQQNNESKNESVGAPKSDADSTYSFDQLLEDLGGLGNEENSGGESELVKPATPSSAEKEIANPTSSSPSSEQTMFLGTTPIERLLAVMLSDAVRSRASDIHIQPTEDGLTVKFRIDGVLFDTLKIPPAMQKEYISRIKVLGKMDIAEHRKAQEGNATIKDGGSEYDLRIAVIPSSLGERIVMRILAKNIQFSSLDTFHLAKPTLLRLRDLIRNDHGLFLVTGPTGSGKSTTLYAILQEINTGEKNILTIEDPIEYRIAGLGQVQVDPKKNLTFASGLRNFLRQDPDVIMVGEIRDAETAVIAVQAALTGHLVLSTLHTNDAVGAIARLKDLGVQSDSIANTLIGVLSQRLVRTNCPDCSLPAPIDADNLARLGLPPETQGNFAQGLGCEKCRQSGYYGRQGLYELLTVNANVQDLILNVAKPSEMIREAKKNGMLLLREDGIAKIINGETTIDEVTRVVAI